MTKTRQKAPDYRILFWPGLKVELGRRNQYLLNKIGPELSRSVQSRAFLGWSLWADGFPGPDDPTFKYTVATRVRKSLSDRDAIAIMEASGLLETCDYSRDVRAYSMDVLERLRPRFGDSDWEVYFRFQEMGTELFFDTIRIDEANAGSELSLKLILMNVFFLAKYLGILDSEIVLRVESWITFNYGRRESPKEDPAAYLSKRRELANEILGNAAIRAYLTDLYEMRSDLLRTFAEKYERRCREIGNTVRAAREKLPPMYPYDLAIWNNFIHLHMLLLGVNNAMEGTLGLVIAKFSCEQAGT